MRRAPPFLATILATILGAASVNAPTAFADGGAPGGHSMAPTGDMRMRGPHDPHMRLSPQTPERAGDRARADALAQATGRAIARYRDVAVAQADGYRVFGDVPEAKVIHYVHPRRSIAERRRIDPERPGSLLYERRGGGLALVGAMFTAPPGSTSAELDRRVPLSQARWHLHTNICTPRPIWSRAKWDERMASGEMVYGAFSPIATRKACRAVGGRFHDTILGWMVHVYPFRSDPAKRWHEAHH